jgi:hypothetical protein
LTLVLFLWPIEAVHAWVPLSWSNFFHHIAPVWFIMMRRQRVCNIEEAASLFATAGVRRQGDATARELGEEGPRFGRRLYGFCA